jgi:hypothetical protein
MEKQSKKRNSQANMSRASSTKIIALLSSKGKEQASRGSLHKKFSSTKIHHERKKSEDFSLKDFEIMHN